MLPTLPASCSRSSTTAGASGRIAGRAPAASSTKPIARRRLQRAQPANSASGTHAPPSRPGCASSRSAGCVPRPSSVITACAAAPPRCRQARAQVLALEPHLRRACGRPRRSRASRRSRTSSGLSRERDAPRLGQRRHAGRVQHRAHRREAAPVRRAGAVLAQRRQVRRRRVALVAVEAVLRIALVQRQAQPVAVHLGQDRRGRDRRAPWRRP